MTARTWKNPRLRIAVAAVVATVSLAACGSGAPTTDAEKLARGKQLVQQMSDRLVSTTAMHVTTTETREVVSISGRKEAVPGFGDYTVRRPDRFHSKTTGGRDFESWYNGKVFTVAVHSEKVFAQAPMPESINRTLDVLAERYDMAMPMADLFYSPAAKALLSDKATGGYVGIENVGDTPCHHVAFQEAAADFDLWIPAQGEPLPKRFKVVQKNRTGKPVIDVIFTGWDFAAQVADDTFAPKVPAEYEGIAVVQRAAAVKHTVAEKR
jgi:hypothetical protein